MFKNSYECVAVPEGDVLWTQYSSLVVSITTYSRSTSSLIYTHDTDENISEMTYTLGWVTCSFLFQSYNWCSELHCSSPWYLWGKQPFRCCRDIFLYVPVLFYSVFLVQYGTQETLQSSRAQSVSCKEDTYRSQIYKVLKYVLFCYL